MSPLTCMLEEENEKLYGDPALPELCAHARDYLLHLNRGFSEQAISPL